MLFMFNLPGSSKMNIYTSPPLPLLKKHKQTNKNKKFVFIIKTNKQACQKAGVCQLEGGKSSCEGCLHHISILFSKIPLAKLWRCH